MICCILIDLEQSDVFECPVSFFENAYRLTGWSIRQAVFVISVE